MILVCAPTRTEARACRRGLAEAHGRPVEVLRTGVGPARAAAALDARLRSGPRPSLVVSSGFAGALTPGIPRHALVTAATLQRLDPGGAAPVAIASHTLVVATGALPCHVASGPGVLIGGSTLVPAPAAVDMESAALAMAAAAAGIPVAVLRVVTDTPSAPFPPFAAALADALAARSPAARLAAGARVLLGAIRRPLRAFAFARSGLAAARTLRRAWSDRARLEQLAEAAR